MKNWIFGLFLFLTILSGQNPVYSDPDFATEHDSIIVFFDAALGDQGLMDYDGDIWAHTGVITEFSTGPSNWKYVVTDWGVNTPDTKLELVGDNLWKLVIGYPYEYYGCPDTEEIIKLAFVFRNDNGSVTGRDSGGADIFLDLYQPGITLVVIQPQINIDFTDPLRSPVFASLSDTVTILATAVTLGTELDSISLFIDDNLVMQTSEDTLIYDFIVSEHGSGVKNLLITSVDTSNLGDTTTFVIMVNPEISDMVPPAGIQPGINYHSATSVTLALFAPYKEFVYLIGDFNDWKVESTFFMNRYQPSVDSTLWWITLDNISVGTEIRYQYLVDGQLRIGDPYSDKILDSWNDGYITPETYPNLIPYPAGKTFWPVSVFQTAQTDFPWQHQDSYLKPEKKNLIIYELLLRDFIERHDFQTLIDTIGYLENLGVNAIELMPFNEFEGNSSWGYNPSYYFAPDKYYGPKEALKAFIDECHRRNIAVIMDIVLNHSYGLSPLVRLYWNSSQGQPSAENPWYNQTHNFQNPDAHWGNDFNHENIHTEAFVKRVNKYWITEYMVDGFRYDFTKGFSNTIYPADSWGSSYDAARIANLKRIADEIWNIDSTTYFILEHLADNSEESELADYGMMLWGNTNYNYNEATMGWHDTYGKSDFSWGYFGSRGWTKPHLVTYMESHDEERLMYKNLQWGNHLGNYAIRKLDVALNRMKLVYSFFLTIPGPKMIWQFGELGYDISIDNPCRVCDKDPVWDYQKEANRKKLYKTVAALTRLRRDHEVFRSEDTNVNLWLNSSSGLKRIKLDHASMSSIIIGNFGVARQSITPEFYHPGWWYDYFSGDSVYISNVNESISLSPGEFHIFTNQFVDPPEPGLIDKEYGNTGPLPKKLILLQNYPNPFNSNTQIMYSLPEITYVDLSIFNLTGQKIRTLIQGTQNRGLHTLTWEGKDQRGNRSSSGVYFYQIMTDKKTLSQKLILLR